MAHVFDAQSLVELPRVNSSSAATVGVQLLAAAAAEKRLAANVSAGRDALAAANAALESALQGALDPAGDPVYAPEARAEAVAWSAAASWLDGLRKLPLPKKAAAAATLHAALFPDGLAFLRLPVAQRWSQTSSRLAHVKEREMEAEFALLDGHDILAALLDAHQALGEAAGITSPHPAAAKGESVRTAFDGWKAAVRCYILQVVANAALAQLSAAPAQQPAAVALSARLLAPLVHAEVAPPARPAPTPPASGSAGEGGAGTSPAA